MSCSPFDLRDYFLKELPEADARRVEAHVKACAGCREELDRLRVAEAALLALRDEEIPQRIAFVSDQVFEPSAMSRWWTAFWNSGPRLGFASAAMLSAAILVFAVTRSAPRQAIPAPAPATASVTASEVQAQIQAAVAQAVKESEARQGERTQKLVADFLRREQEDRKRLVLADDTIRWLERRNNTLSMAASGYRAGVRQ